MMLFQFLDLQTWTSNYTKSLDNVKNTIQSLITQSSTHPASSKYRKFPNDPLFTRFLATATNHYSNIAVNDPACGVQADYAQLLLDISVLRQTLCESLPGDAVDRDNGTIAHEKGKEGTICIVAPGSYHFIVALFATVVIGGAAVVLPTGLIPEEAYYLYRKCNSACLLVAPGMESLAMGIQDLAHQKDTSIPTIPIKAQQAQSKNHHTDYTIAPDLTFPPSHPALILFSSGSTGPPKAVLHTRQLLYGLAATPQKDDFRPGETALSHRPPFWIAGLRPLLSMLPNGVRFEIVAPGSQAEVLWERLRVEKITILACQPIVWKAMMREFEERIARDSDENVVQEYIDGVRRLRIAQCTGGMPAARVKRFWKDMRSGRELEMVYNTTELGMPPIMSDGEGLVDEPVIGKAVPGITVKLSQGDRGEILVKSPYVFSHYVGDPDTTAAQFDAEGFYKTGDLAHLDNGNYAIQGRATSDFIRFLGIKVPIYEVEAKLNDLPYILEAYVFPVPDSESITRVAALVRLSTEKAEEGLSIQALRDDLSQTLSLYKQPTFLRVLGDGEDVPTTRTVKVDSAETVRRYFSPGALGVQAWDISLLREAKPEKAWDFGGMLA
ncbi:hypothetical protein SI65_01400 [Aspergillus cristatus]|uniref:AMP-dependent synthetase/ligase domain-containing protein n=1 Tax=Aspergillus cristatus TaxID=573508 RepID=A0A1E3BSR8_ASPCR|nr:hypothetical protein SI65_01400 [Aspergillus cristatus]